MRIITLLLMSVLGLVSCKQKVQEITPQVRKLTSAVYASGTLVPEQEYKVMSLVDGYIGKAAVKEGDTVHKGQLMFTIINDIREVQEKSAKAIVSRTLPATTASSPQILELQNRLELTRIKLQQDSLDYMRYRNLYEQDAVSKSNYEKYRLQYQTSLKEYASTKQQLQQQRIAANLQLQQAENQLSISATQTDAGTLRSYINGIVYEVYKKVGDFVNPNQALALVGNGDMIARLLVDEDDLGKVYTGQKVLITMDAYPDKVFEAKIRKIYPILNKVEQSFRVDAVFLTPVPVEMYGLNLEANIVVAENKEVLSIPRAALLKGDSVIIKQDGKERRVKIATGIQDDNWVEVKSGLNQSDVLIIN